jgi:hypothetical protein
MASHLAKLARRFAPARAALVPVFLAAYLAASPAAAKRLPPADVAPVVAGDVRYEAPHFGNPCNQNGGCVVAYDNASNAQLWFVQVYCTHYDANLEQDVQDVFITSLAVQNGRVLVSNEHGAHFAVDPATLQVTGDATGCDASRGSGCAVVPIRPGSAGPLVSAALCLALLVWRGRRGTRGHRRQGHPGHHLE